MKRRCLKCNSLNPEDTTRCLVCGSPIAQICPRCGTLRPLGTTRCPRCDDDSSTDAQLFAQIFQERPPSDVKGRYKIVGTFSRGQVSAVYRVQDAQAPGRYLALHEFSEIALLTGEEKRRAREAFREQADRWARLEHPHLVRILDLFSVGDKHYLVRPLVPGWNAAQLIQRFPQAIHEEAVRSWGAQLADLMVYLHQQKPPLYLGELRPERVMIARSGLVVLVDLGLERFFAPPREQGLMITSPYRPPELEAGSWTVAADIYTVGILLYALLARRLLSSGRLPSSLRQSISGLSRRTEAVLLRATRRDPMSRFSSAADMREALWGGPVELQPLDVSQPQEKAVTEAAAPPRAVMSSVTPMRETAPPVAKGRLLVRPRRIEVAEIGPRERKETLLTLHNAGDGDLKGRITSQVSWLTLQGSAFEIPPHQSVDVLVTIWGSRLPHGGAVEPQAILVDSDGGRQWVGVQGRLMLRPALSLSAEVLDFGEVQDARDVTIQLTVNNTGGGMLKGRVQSCVAWLQVVNPDFQVAPQRAAQIQVVLKAGMLTPGRHEDAGALVVDSDAGQMRVGARVRRLQPVLEVAPDVLDFGPLLIGTEGRQQLYIANRGTGELEVTLRSRVPWLHVSPQPYRCGAGETCQATVVADTASLMEGKASARAAVMIHSNAGQVALDAMVTVLAPRLTIGLGELRLEVPLGETRVYPLTLSNAGSAPLHVAIQSCEEWLTATPGQLEVAPGAAADVQLAVGTSRFARGQIVESPRALCLSSDGGDRDVSVVLVVVQPALEVEPAYVDFGVTDRVTPVQRQLEIRNRDTGLLEWQLETDAVWIEITPQHGICEAGQRAVVTLTAYGLALPEEADGARAVLRVVSNGGQREIPMSVIIAAPLLDVDTTEVDLGTSVNYAPAEGSFMIFNRGLAPLRGTITSRVARLVVEPATFICPGGTSQTVRVIANSEGLPAGPMSEPNGILVQSNGGEAMLDVRWMVELAAELEVALAPLVAPEPGVPPHGKLTLKNSGYQAAQVAVMPGAAPLDISRRALVIKPGKTVRLDVTWQGEEGIPADQVSLAVQVDGRSLAIPIEVIVGQQNQSQGGH